MSSEHIARLRAGGTLVVPSRRVGAAVRAHFDLLNQQAGRAAWPAADVLPFDTWFAREFEQAPWRAAALEDAQVLLNASQEQALWQRCIEETDIGRPVAQSASLLRLAQAAWAIAHGWGCHVASQGPTFETLEQRAFRMWASAFERRCSTLGVCDRARVYARVPPGALRADGVRCTGFWEASPVLARILPTRTQNAPGGVASPVYASFPSLETEVAAAVKWAASVRERAPHARIALAYSDPSLVAPLAEACMRRGREYALGDVHASQPWRGELPGPESPLIEIALATLAMSGELSRATAAAWLTSPYLRGAAEERGCRARAASDVLTNGVEAVGCDAVQHAARRAGCVTLAPALEAIQALPRLTPRRAPVKVWMHRFEQVLAAAGWPGDASLGATEQRAQQRWRAVLDTVAALDLVLAPQASSAALALVRDATRRTGRGGDAALDACELMSVSEAAAFGPDYVWIVGLHDAAWPIPAEPNPLLSYAAQRTAGVPGADRTAVLRIAAAEFAALLQQATECRASLALSVGDVAQRACRIAGMPPPVAGPEVHPGHVTDMRSVSPLELCVDVAHPLGDGHTLRGGVGVLTDQSACPFRAFARHRLHARPLDVPQLGLDPRARGDLVHRTLAALWRELGSHDAAAALAPALRAALVSRCVADALAATPEPIAGRELERHRLEHLVLNWLTCDLARPPFEVVAIETSRSLALDRLEFTLRVDRIDRLHDGGGTCVLDYKTGMDGSRRQWSLPRPDQPQLLAYALTEPTVTAVAFACVRSAGCEIVDEPRGRVTRGQLPAAPETWQQEVAAWRAELTRLAADFARGGADVDPKQGASTCRYCDLQTLCRVYDGGPRDVDDDDA